MHFEKICVNKIVYVFDLRALLLWSAIVPGLEASNVQKEKQHDLVKLFCMFTVAVALF